MTREDYIECYLINSPKVVAEMLYDTIERYESRTCENCKFFVWAEQYVSDYGTCEKSIGWKFHGENECDKDAGEEVEVCYTIDDITGEDIELWRQDWMIQRIK